MPFSSFWGPMFDISCEVSFAAGKLAPIFMGKGSKPPEVKKPLLDPEQAKQRMSFLMSGVPEELRKQTAKVVAAAVAVDYPPIPTVSHILQVRYN